MMRICKSLRKKIIFLILISSVICLNLFSEEKKWTIGASAFLTDEDSTSVSKAVSKLLPQTIMGNLSIGETRTISAEEEFSRTLSKKKTERISLYLQLEAAVKTRDALVLQNLSENTLKNRIKTEEKKISDLKEKILNNIQDVEEEEKKLTEKGKKAADKKERNELQKYLYLFKGLVTTEDDSLSEEKITFYGSTDNSSDINLYSPPAEIADLEYTNPDFAKKVYASGINSLLTGKIKVTGDFLFVTCDLYLYPEGKSICTVSEIGTLNDLDFIARSIAHNLSPEISASLPVKITFNVEPKEAADNILFVVDDIVSSNLSQSYILDSGVHSLRFDAPGFQTVSTSYFFEGNGVYDIQVSMKEKVSSNLKITIPDKYLGNLSLNGEFAGKYDEENHSSEIMVNNSKILGVFVGEGESQGFFTVSEKLIKEDQNLLVKPKVFDKSAYIDKRRKWMYGSYSIFLVSLLGTMYTYGTINNMARYYNGELLKYESNPDSFSAEQLEKLDDFRMRALKYQNANRITSGITIAAGAFFGFELVRYFIAADSVLPVSAKENKKNKE